MANLEKFTRYRDNPTLKEPGTSPVATSIEQLEKMTLEERQRVVASIEVLTKYSAKLKDEVAKLAGQLSSADLDKIKAGLEDSLAGRVDEVLKKIDQEERSLDIKNLWFGIQSNAPEIRWEKPNWNKPYEVEIYISLADSTDLASATLQYTVKSPKEYHIFSDNVEGKYVFVRAKDKETGTYGNFSPVVRVEDRDVRLAKFLEYIQGKIKVTALDEKLIAALKEDIHRATQQQIEDELGRVRSEVETTKGQIQNTINAVRESSEQSWSQLRDTVLRNGTNISNIQRKADGLTEEIKTISAKADNAVAGVENINTVIAEKDSAVRREIQNAITQVESTRTEVKRELIQTATNLESKLTAEKDARTQLGNNLARTTEKVDQLSTESDSLKRKTTQIETDVAGNKTKTQQLEENISNLDSSTTKKLESIKSSFNNDHFYNYNMAGGTDGWMLEDFNQDITAKVNTDVGPEDLRYPNLLTSIVNTENIFVKSTQVKPVEREKTYRLTATFKTRSTQANLKEANLYFLPFDKNGNKHRPQDGLLNRQGGAKYPLIQAKTEVQPNGWVTLTGEISTWSSSYPITTAAEANMIPLPTVFACPALELVGKQGAGSFEVDIAVLDLKDISDEKSVTSQIDTVKRTLSDENKALAQQFTSQTSQFKSDVTAQMTQLSKSVTDAQKASNTRIDDIGTRLGASESKIQGLEQTINDEKSSNALKIDTLRADFNKSKANQIDFDLDKTPTFEVYPPTKFRIIDKSAATLISRDFVATYPANKYLKFWGVSLSFKQGNKLPVKPGDRLYASAELFSKSVDTFLYVRYTDENDKYVRGGVAKLVGYVGEGRLAKIENADLIVPNDPKVKYAHISVGTSKPTLSEENDPILISNPQLRHYDETAIRADAKLNDLKIAVSSEVQSYAERTQGIEAELNGRLAQNNIKQTARAEADEVATSKVETAKSELKGSISNIQDTQTTLSNTVKAQTEELKAVKSDYKSDISKANSRIDSTNTTLNDRYSSLSSKADTLESNYRALDDKYTQSEARNKAEFSDNLDTVKTELKGKIDQSERTTSDQYRTLAERTTTLESKADMVDGRISNAVINERTNTEATASRVATEKSNELKVQFDARMISDQNNLLAFTNTMDWYLHKDDGEPQPQTVEEGNAATLRGDTTNWKHAFQASREGDKSNDPKASLALTQVQPDLPYILTFEARSNIAGNVINPMLRLYYKDANNAKQSRNSNVPSIPLVDEWRSYQVILTAPSIKANETRNYFACLFEMKSTGTIQIRNPRLAYDAKTAIERINASIVETKQLAVDASGKVRAKIGLKVNANGKAVGWSSEVNGDTNNFSINADNFKIANGADDYTPFSIDTVNKKIRINGEAQFTKGNNLLMNPIMSSTAINNSNDYRVPMNSVPGWQFGHSSTNGRVDFFEARARGSDWSPDVEFLPGELCLNIRNDNRARRDQERTGFLFQDISVTPGNWYMFSAWVASHGSKCGLRVEELDENGRFVKVLGSSDYVKVIGGRDLNNYRRLFVKFKATSPNLRLALEQFNMANEDSTSVLQSFIFRPMLEECSEFAVGPSAWSNSSVNTVVDGNTLKTGSVVANKLILSPSNNILFNSQFKSRGMDRNGPQQYTRDYNRDLGILGWFWWDRDNWDNRLLVGITGAGDPDWGSNDTSGWDSRVAVIRMEGNIPGNVRDGTWRGWLSTIVDVVPGKEYIFSYYGANHRCEGFAVIENYDHSGYYYRSYNSAAICTSEYTRWAPNHGGLVEDNSKGRTWVKFTAPATGKICIAFTFRNIVGDSPYFFFTRPMLEEAQPDQTTPSRWQGGPMGSITGRGEVVVEQLSAISTNLGYINAGSMNIGGKFLVYNDGLVEIWGHDRNNGFVIDPRRNNIRVMQNGHVKLKLGQW